jgi:hypothetical protein
MSIWRIFVVSLLSPKQIAEFVAEKKRKLLAFLSFLILICLIPSFISTSVVINTTVDNFQTFMKSKDVPEFQLKNNVLTSDATEPLVKQFDGGVFIFDTTGAYNEEKVAAEKADLAILKDRIIMYDGTREQQVMYQDLGGFEFSKSMLLEWVDLFANLTWLLIIGAIFFIYLFEFFKILFISFIMALIGLALNASLQTKLPFGRLWVIAGFSLTIPTVVSWVLDAFTINLPFSGMLYVAACSVILFFVLREVSYRPTKGEPESNELTS